MGSYKTNETVIAATKCVILGVFNSEKQTDCKGELYSGNGKPKVRGIRFQRQRIRKDSEENTPKPGKTRTKTTSLKKKKLYFRDSPSNFYWAKTLRLDDYVTNCNWYRSAIGKYRSAMVKYVTQNLHETLVFFLGIVIQVGFTYHLLFLHQNQCQKSIPCLLSLEINVLRKALFN